MNQMNHTDTEEKLKVMTKSIRDIKCVCGSNYSDRDVRTAVLVLISNMDHELMEMKLKLK